MASMTKNQLLAQLLAIQAELAALKAAQTPAPQAEPRKAPSLETKGAKPWSFGQVRNLFKQLRPLNKARRASYLKACANRPLEQRREIYRKLQRYDKRIEARIAA